MKSKSIYTKIVFFVTTLAIVLVYLFGYTYSQFAPLHVFATDPGVSSEAEGSQVEKLQFENDEELKKFSLLGGTNSERALAEYPGLGISKEFSIFAEGDVTLTGADTEGKIAVGGTLNAVAEDKSQLVAESAEGESSGDAEVEGEVAGDEGTGEKYYKYQVGIKNEDKNAADIIVGQGLTGEVALDFGYSADGETQVEDSKLVAYSSKATGMNLEKYTEEERKHFVQVDLIDFGAEFSRLRDYSKELADKEVTGQMLADQYGTVGNVGLDLLEIMTGKTEPSDLEHEWTNRRRESVHQSKVFRGDNKDLNIFTVSASEISSNNVVFDVPYNSKVVLNITGDNIKLDFGIDHNIYYPLTEEKLAEIDVNKQRIGYVKKKLDNEQMAEYITDEDDTIRPFIRIAGGDANEGNLADLSDNILINITEAEKLELYDCGVSVLAPNTAVSTPISSNVNSPSHYAGYFLGTLICKSYEGNLQFGSIEKNINRKYRLNLSKVDEVYGNYVAGAGLELYNSEGALIHSWTSTENTESVELDMGTYTIKETGVPDNYENSTQDLTFTVDVYGDVVSNGEKIAKADVIFTKDYEEKSYEDCSADWDTDSYEGEIKFPINWDMLYNNLDENVGNVTRVSFDVNTDNATTSKDKDLYMLVAENNGRGYGENWIEYVKYKKVEDGETITTKVPYVPEMYAYYNEHDKPENIKFMPHFYRQDMSSDEEAEEVHDIDVENIKVYWKEVKRTTKTKVIETSLKNNDMSEVKIPNKHIVTTIKITKLDADTKVALKNAIFGVYSKSDNKLLYKSDETDDNGVVILNEIPLDKGSYYVKELTAPDGYQLSDEVKEFDVEQTGSVECIFENKVSQDDISGNIPDLVGTSGGTSGSGTKGENDLDYGTTSDDNKKEEVTQELIKNSITTGDTIFVAIILLGISLVVVAIALVAENVNKKK